MAENDQRPDQGALRGLPPGFKTLGSLIVPDELEREILAKAKTEAQPRKPEKALDVLEEYLEKSKLMDAAENGPAMQAWAEYVHATHEGRAPKFRIRGTISHLNIDPERVLIEECLRSYAFLRAATGYPALGAPVWYQPAGMLTLSGLRRVLPSEITGQLDEKNLPGTLFAAGIPAFDTGEGALDQHDDEENRWGSRLSSFDLFDVWIGKITGKRLTEWDPRLIPVLVSHDRQDLLGQTLGNDPAKGWYPEYANTGRTFTELLRGWNLLCRAGELTSAQVLALAMLASRAARMVVNADFERIFGQEIKPLLEPLRMVEQAYADLDKNPSDRAALDLRKQAMDALPPADLPKVLGRYDAARRQVYVMRRMGGGVRELLRSSVHPALEADPLIGAPLGLFGVRYDDPVRAEGVWREHTEAALLRQEAEWVQAARDVRYRPPQFESFKAFVFDRLDDPRHEAEDKSGRAVARDITVVYGHSDSSRWIPFLRAAMREGWTDPATGQCWPRPDVIIQFRDTWLDPSNDSPLHGGKWRMRKLQGGVVFWASTFWRPRGGPALRLDTAGALLRALHAISLKATLPQSELACAEFLLQSKNILFDVPGGQQFATPYIPAFRVGTGNLSPKNPYQLVYPFSPEVVVAHICEALGRGMDVNALLQDARLRADPREWFSFLHRRMRERLIRRHGRIPT